MQLSFGRDNLGQSLLRQYALEMTVRDVAREEPYITLHFYSRKQPNLASRAMRSPHSLFSKNRIVSLLT
jgi:hypothetical protein